MEKTLGRLVDTVRKSNGSALIHNFEAVELGNGASIENTNSLCICEPRRNCQHTVRQIDSISLLDNALDSSQHNGHDVLSRDRQSLIIVVHIESHSSMRHLRVAQGRAGQLSLHLRIVIIAAHEELHAGDGVFDIGLGNGSSSISNKSLFSLKRHAGGSLSV
mmetsp:Transcript_21277/g.35830  ORF Transcript_21277/g.35830 Transcript_21277/m.35830 type:complete len:162 (-) Transcript_21277:149-634(-)